MIFTKTYNIIDGKPIISGYFLDNNVKNWISIERIREKRRLLRKIRHHPSLWGDNGEMAERQAERIIKKLTGSFPISDTSPSDTPSASDETGRWR